MGVACAAGEESDMRGTLVAASPGSHAIRVNGQHRLISDNTCADPANTSVDPVNTSPKQSGVSPVEDRGRT